MKTVVFTKKGTVNRVEYKKGDVLRVSTSIFNDLVNVQNVAKEKTNGTTGRSSRD